MTLMRRLSRQFNTHIQLHSTMHVLRQNMLSKGRLLRPLNTRTVELGSKALDNVRLLHAGTAGSAKSDALAMNLEKAVAQIVSDLNKNAYLPPLRLKLLQHSFPISSTSTKLGVSLNRFTALSGNQFVTRT